MNDDIMILHIERLQAAIPHRHRESGPGTFHGVARDKDDFQCRKVIHNSDNHFLWHDAVNGGDVTRKQLAFRGEEAPITLSINEWHRAERFHRRKEETVAFIARSSFAPIDRVPGMTHLVEVPKLFYGRHPKIGMGVELVIQPRGPSLLRADTKKIRPPGGIEFSGCPIAENTGCCKHSANVHSRFYLTS